MGRTTANRRTRTALACSAALTAALLPSAQTARAADFTWNNASGTGLWTDPANWDLNASFPNATGDSAAFATLGLATVNLNGAKTVGALSFSNATGSFALAPAGDTLTLDNGAGGASLTQSGGGTNTIATRLVAANLTANVNAGSLILSNTTAGANVITGSFNVAAGASLEGQFTATSNALGGATINLGGGVLTLRGVGAPAANASLGNALNVTDNATLALVDTPGGVSLGGVTIANGKSLALTGPGANLAASTLNFAGATSTRTATLDVGAGGTLTLNKINSTLLNQYTIVKTGAGQLIAAPAVTPASGIVVDVQQGRFIYQAELSKSPLVGGILLSSPQSVVEFQTLAGQPVVNSAVSASENATIEYTAPADGQPHVFTLFSGSHALAVTAPGKTVTVNVKSETLKFTGDISGTNITLAKIGSGNLELNSASTFTGTTTVAPGPGYLKLGNATALGASSLALGVGQRLDLATALSGAGSLTVAPGAYVRLSNSNSLSGAQFTSASIPAGANIVLPGPLFPSGLDQVNPAVSYTQAGTSAPALVNLAHDPAFPTSGLYTNTDLDAFATPVISAGNGVVLASTTGRTLSFNKSINAGTNVLTIGSLAPIDGLAKNGIVSTVDVTAAGINVVSGTYSGDVDHGGGPIVIGPDATFRATVSNSARRSTVFLSGGNANVTSGTATLGFDPVLGGLAGAGTVVIGAGVIDATDLHLNIGKNNQDTRFAGVISQNAGTNAASLQKAGTGLLQFVGQNTYRGLTTVQGGTLLLRGDARLSLGDVSTTGVASTLRIESPANLAPGAKVNGNLALDGMFDPTPFFAGGARLITINVDNYAIPLDLAALGGVNGSLGTNRPKSVTVLTGATTTSTASLNLPGNGTYAATSLGAGTRQPGFFDPTQGLYRLGGGGGRLTILNGVLVGNNGLEIVSHDDSTVVLAAPNTLTGTTIVDGNTLVIKNGDNGSATGNGPVIISGLAALAGSGAVRSDTTLRLLTVQSTATLSPGDGAGDVGTLRVFSSADPNLLDSARPTLDLQGNSRLAIDLNPGGVGDLVTVTGRVGITNSILDAALLAAPNFGDVIPLILNDFSDPIGGTFAGLPEGATFDLLLGGIPHSFTITYHANLDGATVGNDVAITAVPEPASFALVAVGTVFARRRNRRTSRLQ